MIYKNTLIIKLFESLCLLGEKAISHSGGFANLSLRKN